jgi:hypothetical protein
MRISQLEPPSTCRNTYSIYSAFSAVVLKMLYAFCLWSVPVHRIFDLQNRTKHVRSLQHEILSKSSYTWMSNMHTHLRLSWKLSKHLIIFEFASLIRYNSRHVNYWLLKTQNRYSLTADVSSTVLPCLWWHSTRRRNLYVILSDIIGWQPAYHAWHCEIALRHFCSGTKARELRRHYVQTRRRRRTTDRTL